MRSTLRSMRFVVLAALATAVVLTTSTVLRAAEPLRWKLKAGDKFDYVMTQDMNMDMAGGPGGQQVKTKMHQQMDMTWDVQSINADGNAVISQSINRVRMNMAMPGQSFQYDTQSKEAPTGIAAMIAPIYEAMTQAPFQVTMTPRGEIVDVNVPEKMLDAMKNVPGAASMGEMTTAEGFKKMATQGSMVLPEGAPTPGMKWNSSMEMNNQMMGKMIVDTTYEYTGTKDVEGATCAVIKPTVATKFEGSGQMPMTFKNESSSGEILFNEDAGRLQSSTIKQGMTIDINMGNQSMQQTIDQTMNVKLTPAK